jgi:hypothetical protein
VPNSADGQSVPPIAREIPHDDVPTTAQNIPRVGKAKVTADIAELPRQELAHRHHRDAVVAIVDHNRLPASVASQYYFEDKNRRRIGTSQSNRAA